MATVRFIDAPPELAKASGKVLSPDGHTVACRLEGLKPGLWAFDVGAGARALKLDEPGLRFHTPSWSNAGDLLFHVAESHGKARVGVVPAFGRGSAIEFEGTGIAVGSGGRSFAVADGAGVLRSSAVEAGNSPFHAEHREVAHLFEADPDVPLEMEITADGRWVVVVSQRAARSPALLAYPMEGGKEQELVPPLAPPSFLSFALSDELLAVLELREGPAPTSRLFVRELAAGSLGTMRLGAARDLLFLRSLLPQHRPAFSPDGTKVAVLGLSEPGELALDLLSVRGGKAERATSVPGLRGSPRFLGPGELVVDGVDRVSVITL